MLAGEDVPDPELPDPFLLTLSLESELALLISIIRYLEKSQQPFVGDLTNIQHCPLAKATKTRPLKWTIWRIESGSLTLQIQCDH